MERQIGGYKDKGMKRQMDRNIDGQNDRWIE